MNKKIMVTGASSMLGRSLIKHLGNNVEIFSIRHDVNLVNQSQTEFIFENIRPDVCFFLAGYNGNIGFNIKYPADIYYNTAQINLNCLKFAHKYNVQKCVSIISSCAYPDKPIADEGSMHSASPNPTVECHAQAKRLLDIYSRQLYKQYKFDAVCAVSNHIIGPYDNFDENKTKVVGGLIKKFTQAKLNNSDNVVCWGTGNPLREFVYVDDVAKNLIKLSESEYREIPINITNQSNEISIRDLALLIAEIIGYKGEIIWDTSKPDGQYRKSMIPTIGYECTTPLKEALQKTIDWYMNG